MINDDLFEFIKWENQRLKDNFLTDYDDGKKTLAQAVKINEEVGELCDEVLHSLNLQRKEKANPQRKKNLAIEFADVIITTLLLADTMGVDVKEALDIKVKKIKERTY